MYLRRLKFAFVSSAFVFLWLGFGIQSPSDDAYVASIVNYVYAQDPGCTNEDCPPDPGCTNEDCPPDPGCTNEDCPPAYTEELLLLRAIRSRG